MRFSKKGSRHFVQRGFCPYVADHQAQRSQLSHYLMLPQTPPNVPTRRFSKKKSCRPLRGLMTKNVNFLSLSTIFACLTWRWKSNFDQKTRFFMTSKNAVKKRLSIKLDKTRFSVFFSSSTETWHLERRQLIKFHSTQQYFYVQRDTNTFLNVKKDHFWAFS